MERMITFDDVLIKPRMSSIVSRKDVDISCTIGDLKLSVPVISANMDTVTNEELSIALYNCGGISCFPRFESIEDNVSHVKTILSKNANVIGSVGLGDHEFERACALIEAGLKYICIDVAHGAQIAVTKQYNQIIEKYKDKVAIIVGNFATGESIAEFSSYLISEPMAYKVGIGSGAACLTRTQTGCGVPQLSAVLDSIKHNPKATIISDGGIKLPGDVAKALAAGAKAVMLGSMIAGCDEGPGELIDGKFKKYRGSASQESYEVQSKLASWRTFEGDSFLVSHKGSISAVVQNIEGGLRSSFSYVGASNLEQFQEKAEFIEISASTTIENGSHGKSR